MSRLHLGGALRTLPKRQCTVYRQTGAFIDGRWKKGGEEIAFRMRAIVQPAQPRDQRHLPEGSDAADAIVIHSKHEMNTVDEATQREADVVEVDGMGRYEVVSVADWSGQGFRRYLAGSLS